MCAGLNAAGLRPTVGHGGTRWDTVDWKADPDWEWHSAAEADPLRESVDGLTGE